MGTGGLARLANNELAQLLHEDIIRNIVSKDDRADILPISVLLRLAGVETGQQEAGLAAALVTHHQPRLGEAGGHKVVGIFMCLLVAFLHVLIVRVLQKSLHSISSRSPNKLGICCMSQHDGNGEARHYCCAGDGQCAVGT